MKNKYTDDHFFGSFAARHLSNDHTRLKRVPLTGYKSYEKMKKKTHGILG